MNCKRLLLLTIVIAGSLAFSGCAKNLFEGVGKSDSNGVGFSTPSDLSEQIETASSHADFEKISVATTTLLESVDTPSSNVPALLVLRSKAVVGQNDLGVIQVVNSIFDLNSIGSSSQSVFMSDVDNSDSARNVFEILRDLLARISLSDLQTAALDIDIAAYVASTNSNIIALSPTVQLFRGVVNAMAIDKMLLLHFNITDDGVALIDDRESVVTIMASFFGPGNTYQPVFYVAPVSPTIGYFYRNMREAFHISHSLPTRVEARVDDISSVVSMMEDLYASMLLPNGTYTVDGHSYLVGTSVGTDDRNRHVLNAISAIFRTVL